ncbi:DEKNAAC102723 [Brettanomyces naardenensis]|uniref:DEKNAAC102723 n=1 Tax=Brettanomyces naardenensis TaxID=13370 RepID=A0A448YKS7_BRENA|nr:DEKNAAC102723 [Brettanomyces naardenensis]
MVRLKTRYILFEILYPQRNTIPIEESYDTVSKSIISLHQPSSQQVNGKQIIHLIKASLQKNFGDYGTSMAVGLTMRYFSTRTSTGILRVSRSNCMYIVAAMTFISSLEDEKCIFNCIGVSGSIKKCEDRSIERSRLMIRNVGGTNVATESDSLTRMFTAGDASVEDSSHEG